MGCLGCLPNEREQEAAKQAAINKAKTYAVEKKVWVIVYKNEMQEYSFIEAGRAAELNITGQFISPVQ